MIIKQGKTNKVVAESKKDFFVDGKHVKDSDLYIEHKVGSITYIIYMGNGGVVVSCEAACEYETILKPTQFADQLDVLITFKPEK